MVARIARGHPIARPDGDASAWRSPVRSDRRAHADAHNIAPHLYPYHNEINPFHLQQHRALTPGCLWAVLPAALYNANGMGRVERPAYKKQGPHCEA